MLRMAPAFLAVSVVALAFSFPATVWGHFQPLGGVIVGDPSCAVVGSPVGLAERRPVTCAVVGTDGALYGIRFDPRLNVSTGFRRLGGAIVGNPSCVHDDLLTLTCAVRGTDNGLYAISFDPEDNFSTGFQPLGGIVVSNPSCTTGASSFPKVICGVVGTDNALFAIGFETALPGVRSASSTGYERLGGIVVDDPSCGVAGSIPTCGVKGPDNFLYSVAVTPGVEDVIPAFRRVTGPILGSPSCVGHIRGGGGLLCGVRGFDNSLSVVFFSRSSGAIVLSDLIPDIAMLGNPSCTGDITSKGLQFFCVVVGANAGNGLFGIALEANPSLAPIGEAVSFGAIVVGTPACVSNAVGDPAVRVQLVPEMMCAVKGTDYGLSGIVVLSLARFPPLPD